MGLLLIHYGIRHLMREVAGQAELDPDRMSFIRALRVICRQVPGQAAFPPRRVVTATRKAIEEILEGPNPARRERSCPRAVDGHSTLLSSINGIGPSLYRAYLPARRPVRLGTAASFLPCYFPVIRLSALR
jgi:hypothetical protein